MRVFTSESQDVAVNLALEQWLLSRIPKDEEWLFLYENSPAVVFGRFQNPWKECRLSLIEEWGWKFSRRFSGGGTVVHGLGNLNFCVIRGTPVPRKQQNLDRVISALATLGLKCERNARLDIVLPINNGPRKVSGSAFRQTSQASLHHGTLLIFANLSLLSQALKVPQRTMNARGVDSVPSPVANLQDALQSEISMAMVQSALAKEWGCPLEILSEQQALEADENEAYTKARFQQNSWEWTWGKTPKFTEKFWGLPGSCTLQLEVEKGRIAQVHGCIDSLAEALMGLPYRGNPVLKALGPTELAQELAKRIEGESGNPSQARREEN